MTKLHEYIVPFSCTFLCLLRYHAFDEGTDLHVEFIASVVLSYVLRKALDARCHLTVGQALVKGGALWAWMIQLSSTMWTRTCNISSQARIWIKNHLLTVWGSWVTALLWIKDRSVAGVDRLAGLSRGARLGRICFWIGFLVCAAVGAVAITLSMLWVLQPRT